MPRLETQCTLCTLKTPVQPTVKVGESVRCIRCERTFVVAEIRSASSPYVSANDTAIPRPIHCTKCKTGLLPKESRCRQCGLKVVEMVVSDVDTATDSNRESESTTQAGRPAVYKTGSPFVEDVVGKAVDFSMQVQGNDVVTCAAMSWDNKLIAACGSLGSLTLFSGDVGRTVSKTDQLKLPRRGSLYATAFLPDGEHLVIGGRCSKGLSFSWGPYLAVWNARKRQEVLRLDPRCGTISEIAVSPSGRISVIDINGWIEVFEPGEAVPSHRFQTRVSKIMRVEGQRALARFSAGGDYVVCCNGRTAFLWDVMTGAQIRRFEMVKHRRFPRIGGIRRVLQIAAPSPTGTQAVLGGGGQWRVPLLNLPATKKQYQKFGHVKWLKRGEISVWSTETNELESELSTQPDGTDLQCVMDLTFLEDETQCAVLTVDGALLFWKVGATRSVMRERNLDYSNFLVSSPDGRAVLTKLDRMVLRLYRVPWRVS